MPFFPSFDVNTTSPVWPPLQEGIWAGVSPVTECESRSMCSNPQAGGRTFACRTGGWGRGRRKSSYFQEAVNGNTYIRHARNMHWNSKTFPQKLFIIAGRHALTKIHLQKAGRVLLCTSVHAPFLLYILQDTERYSQKGHQEVFGVFFTDLTLPHTGEYFLFQLLLC